MEEIPEADKYEISEDFDNLSFGFPPAKVAGFGGTKDIKTIGAKASSIPAFICGVVEDGLAGISIAESPLHNHVIGHDEGANLIYLRAEIKQDSLDKGSDLREYNLAHYRPFLKPGFSIIQLIPKELGGYDSGDNMFLLHSSADIPRWKDALSKCYDHVKMNEGNVVRIIYILCHVLGDIRPFDIFYNFKFYTNNGEKLVDTIENKLHNPN